LSVDSSPSANERSMIVSVNGARTTNSSVYDEAFFAGQVEQCLQSARAVVRVVHRLFTPRSVVDVGCGLGAWLHAFSEMGVNEVCGIDGDYVNRRNLLIPPAKFISQDLGRPFEIPGRYDLAMCLEVAEHLSAQAGARLVQALSQAAPLVMFSAAVPGQGGLHHINEQWPAYWRALFTAEGFRLFDPIRPLIRDEASVRWWYRQNLLLFASPEGVSAHQRLRREVMPGKEMEWVHFSLVDKPRGLRSTLLKVPGIRWAWSHAKPWVRPNRPSTSQNQPISRRAVRIDDE
jgi:SAM-dependent methyltransferase